MSDEIIIEPFSESIEEIEIGGIEPSCDPVTEACFTEDNGYAG